MQAIILLFVMASCSFSYLLGNEPETKANSYLILQFPQAPQSLYYKVTGEFPITMASVYLPTDYDKNKNYPLVLWIDGATGGAGDVAKFAVEKLGNKGLIIINFPIIKDSLDAMLPDSSNQWDRLTITDTDSRLSWNTYKTMLDSIYKIIPNIDTANTFMGGFSNGGHTTTLIMNHSFTQLKNYFKNFYFIEGGEGLKDNFKFNNTPILYMQGALSPDWIRPFYNIALKNGANADFILMNNTGHDFPKQYHKTLREWIDMHVY